MGIPVRVLHVFGSLRLSGGEEMLRAAAPLWAGHDVHPTVLAIGAEPGPAADRLAAAGYPVRWLPMRPRGGVLTDVDALVRREPFDVVHLHTEWGSFWLALLARRAGAGVVRTVHAPFAFEGWLRAERVVQRAVLRHTGVAFVAVSPSVAANEAERFANPCPVIANWCDLDRFAPVGPAQRHRLRADFGVGVDERLIVSVGNCSPVKDHSLLLHSLAGLHEKIGEWRYLHVGDPAGDAAESELARRLGIADRVDFLGARSDVDRILASGDAFAMTSRYEGMGVAAVEAGAAGVPLVLADVPGLRDVAQAVPDARLVARTPEAVRTGLVDVLLMDEDTRSALATRQRAAVERRFAPDRGVEAYVERYRSVAKRRDAPHAATPGVRPELAVLITAHNRVALTLRALAALERQQVDAEVEIWLVDDGSSDGTAGAVREHYPHVRLIPGSGELFWVGGMALARQRARGTSQPTHLVWLNDDVELHPHAFAELLATERRLTDAGRPRSLVVGTVTDPISGEATYGGLRRASRLRPMRFDRVPPTGEPEPCDTMNGNVVLVPSAVDEVVGAFDTGLAHAMADIDIGLKARAAGFEVWQAGRAVGTCAAGDVPRAATPRARAHQLLAPKGLPPAAWWHLTRRHAGVLWPVCFVSPYLRFIAGELRSWRTGAT
jgi:glycosyltransferase involved in cell wall biosynthesis/GT2 family glycosyltransferase